MCKKYIQKLNLFFVQKPSFFAVLNSKNITAIGFKDNQVFFDYDNFELITNESIISEKKETSGRIYINFENTETNSKEQFFKTLKKLLLQDGREFSRKNCNVIGFNFYK